MSIAHQIASALRALPGDALAHLVRLSSDDVAARVARLVVPSEDDADLLAGLTKLAAPAANELVAPANDDVGASRLREHWVEKVSGVLQEDRAFSSVEIAKILGTQQWRVRHALADLKDRGRAFLYGSRRTAVWARSQELADTGSSIRPIARVRALLAQHNKLTTRTAARRLGLSEKQAQAFLRRLTANGEARCTGMGPGAAWESVTAKSKETAATVQESPAPVSAAPQSSVPPVERVTPQRITTVLREDRAFTTPEIAERLGARSAHVRPVLHAMVDQGQVASHGTHAHQVWARTQELASGGPPKDAEARVQALLSEDKVFRTAEVAKRLGLPARHVFWALNALRAKAEAFSVGRGVEVRWARTEALLAVVVAFPLRVK